MHVKAEISWRTCFSYNVYLLYCCAVSARCTYVERKAELQGQFIHSPESSFHQGHMTHFLSPGLARRDTQKKLPSSTPGIANWIRTIRMALTGEIYRWSALNLRLLAFHFQAGGPVESSDSAAPCLICPAPRAACRLGPHGSSNCFLLSQQTNPRPPSLIPKPICQACVIVFLFVALLPACFRIKCNLMRH